MRSRHKEWKNGKYPKWNRRITWYQKKGGQDIRLRLEDPDGVTNVYPDSPEQAQKIWDDFKGKEEPSNDFQDNGSAEGTCSTG